MRWRGKAWQRLTRRPSRRDCARSRRGATRRERRALYVRAARAACCAARGNACECDGRHVSVSPWVQKRALAGRRGRRRGCRGRRGRGRASEQRHGQPHRTAPRAAQVRRVVIVPARRARHHARHRGDAGVCRASFARDESEFLGAPGIDARKTRPARRGAARACCQLCLVERMLVKVYEFAVRLIRHAGNNRGTQMSQMLKTAGWQPLTTSGIPPPPTLLDRRCNASVQTARQTSAAQAPRGVSSTAQQPELRQTACANSLLACCACMLSVPSSKMRGRMMMRT